MAELAPSATPSAAAPAAPLHGQDDDIAMIRNLRESGQVRLLTGPGGAGKIRPGLPGPWGLLAGSGSGDA
jgi:hypothetical protein